MGQPVSYSLEMFWESSFFCANLKEEIFSKMHHRKIFSIRKLYVHKDHVTFNTSLRRVWLMLESMGKKRRKREKIRVEDRNMS